MVMISHKAKHPPKNLHPTYCHFMYFKTKLGCHIVFLLFANGPSCFPYIKTAARTPKESQRYKCNVCSHKNKPKETQASHTVTLSFFNKSRLLLITKSYPL